MPNVDRNESKHVTVLLEESIEQLAIRAEGFYVDCTAGGGGHSEAIAQRLATGRLLAMDRDPRAVELTGNRLAKFGDKVTVRQASFSRLKEMVDEVYGAQVNGAFMDGIIADLGMS